MSQFDSLIIGEVAQDTNVDYDGTTVHAVGGAVYYSGFAAANTGHKTAVLPKARILILQKGLLVVFLLLFLSVGLAKTYTRTYSNEDIYYENFCNEYAGVVTEKTEQFFTEKRAFYREIDQILLKFHLPVIQ